MIHLYAFAKNLRSLPVERGVEGSPLEVCEVEGATAVVSRLQATPLQTTHEALIRHGLVVEALLDHADSLLPVRFGERFDDEDGIAAAARRLRPDVRSRLDRLEGCVEVGVRVVDRRRQEPVVHAPDGTGYMHAQLELSRARDRMVSALHAPLDENASASAVGAPGAGGVVHTASYLVRRDAVPAFTRLVDGYAATHPQLTVVCTGPWAPYSFAGEAEAAA